MTTTLGLLSFFVAALATVAHARLRNGRNGAGEGPDSTKVTDKYLNYVYGNSRLTVISRVHGVSATHLAETSAVVSFIRSVESYATSVILCIGIGDELEHASYVSDVKNAIATEKFRDSLQIVVLPVVPWGKFTPALNAAIAKVAEKGDGFIAFQSLEFRISQPSVKLLLDYVSSDDSVLVAGPRMQGHEWSSSSDVRVVLRGRTSPWNTFAIWRTRYLALTGFPLVADGMGGNMGGVEEVTAITLLQRLFPELQAVLARVEGVSWETNFSDPKRMQWHEDKMRSKDERPAKQLEWLNMRGGTVRHVAL